MEIFTVLKANIRYRKGSFFSIFLLMVIISASLTAVLSTLDNCGSSIEKAHQTADTADFLQYISDHRYTQELEHSLKNHPLVEKTEDYRCVAADEAVIGENEHYKNAMFLMKLNSHVKLIQNDGIAYREETPALKKGEIYVTKGMLTNLNGKVGDTLTIKTIGGTYAFTVRGIVLEPYQGAFVIGYKQMFVSDGDMESILADARAAETEVRTADLHALMIWQKDDSTLTCTQFRRRLNLDTGITDQGTGSMTREMSVYYTSLFPQIVAAILAVFIMLLTVIVLIVMGHSISTAMEMDYVNLGILKSYGFAQGRIRLVFMLQYVLAEISGAASGMVLSIPLVRALPRTLWPVTAVVMEGHMSFQKSLAVLVAVVLLSCLFIFLITGKAGRISPVRAIAGGRPDIYFDSRIKAPVFQKGLQASLAFRQFVSGRRRYGASVIVAAILVFFMLTMTLLANMFTSKTAAQSMGSAYGECTAEFLQAVSDEKRMEIRQTVEEYSAVEEAYYWVNPYFSIEGEEIMCVIYRDTQQFAMLKGRAPVYDNEIVITEILAEELELKMGDEADIGYHGRKRTFLVSGICQCLYDTGRCFGMSGDGAQMLGFEPVYWAAYSLKQPEQAAAAVDALNAAYGDILKAEQQTGLLNETYETVIRVVRAVIFSFSVIFALVVVQMVCAKAYLQEKTDIGIYKAVGFSTMGLRLQFAFRFLFVAAAGSAAGILISVIFSGRMLSSLLRGMGITSMYVEFTAAAAVVPAGLVCGCFFMFAFWASGRVRRVSVRELVTE